MLAYLWTYAPLLSEYGLWGAGIAACLAIAWFLPGFRLQALVTAGALLLGLICIQYGDRIGAKRIQDQWDNAVEAAVERSEGARSDAVRDVGDGTDGLSNDPYNRDRQTSPMRRVARNHLLRE